MKLYNAGSVFRDFRGLQNIAMAWFCKRRHPLAPYEELIANYHELDALEREQARNWINECFTSEEATALSDYIREWYHTDVVTEEISVPIIGERINVSYSSEKITDLRAFIAGKVDNEIRHQILSPTPNRGLGSPYRSACTTSMSGFYHLFREKGYSLPFSVWGYYRVIGEPLEKVFSGVEEVTPFDLRSRVETYLVILDREAL